MVSGNIERGEALAQRLSPATLCVPGSPDIPCKVGQIHFHEMLGPGGIREIRSMHVTVRRVDVKGNIDFTLGLQLQVKRMVRQPGEAQAKEEIIPLEVGQNNGSDATTICLTLERPPV